LRVYTERTQSNSLNDLDERTKQIFESLKVSLLGYTKGGLTPRVAKCGTSVKGAMPWSACGPEVFARYKIATAINASASTAASLGLRLRYASCAGSTTGTRDGILSYLNHFESMYRSELLCNDQGVHNMILNFAAIRSC
jgi:hypothetical protein